MKIPNKLELQQIEFNQFSETKFKDFMKLKSTPDSYHIMMILICGAVV